MPDADIFALAFMVRTAMKEIARIKNPEDPDTELERMGNDVLHAIRETPVAEEVGDQKEVFRQAIFEAALHILPGRRRVQ